MSAEHDHLHKPAATRILVVDDDPAICTLVADHLTRHGMTALTAGNASVARTRLARDRFDLIVLDIMLPGEDGLSLCRAIRAAGRTPVIMLTAVADDTDRIIGLEMGADDYLTKPFNPRELVARIRAVLRRTSERVAVHDIVPDRRYRFVGWQLDPGRRELTNPAGTLVPLTDGEFDLLLAFVQQPRRVLSRDQLLDATRGRDAGPFDRSIDVACSRLRRRIETDPKRPALLKTVRGGGYLLAADVEQL